MRQMREHGTPGHMALSRRRWQHDRPFSSRPDRAEAEVIGAAGQNARRAAPAAIGPEPVLRRPRCRKLNPIRSARAKHVADFPQLLPLRNSQISPRLLYRACKQELTNKKRVPCVYASRSIAVSSGWISGIGGRCSLARRSSGCSRSFCEGCDRHDNCARGLG